MLPPVPIAILKNLRCGHCRKFVSCGPVYVTPDSSIICGRCVRYAKQNYRNTAFEALASIYRYPCHYWSKHCNKRLAWNESLDHERKCLFQSGCNVFCSRPGTYFKSDRKLPNRTEINLEHVTDEIIQNLKCVTCELYLSNGPVYVTVDGKNICHRCIHSNGVHKGAIQNLAYERIASSIIFPCIYRFRGCTIRLQFGREMWGHENECPYGQAQQKLLKKASRAGKDGKERGVIETHSGHIWGTITPHSALFAPPKTKNNDGKIVTQELTEVMKKKHQEEVKGFDAQSMDSVASRASTFDSIGDFSRSIGDNISRDNISRSTFDNISRDNVSRTTTDNISKDNISSTSSRIPAHDEYRRYSNETILDDNNYYRPSVSRNPNEQPRPSNYEIPRQSQLPRPNEEQNAPYSVYPHEQPRPSTYEIPRQSQLSRPNEEQNAPYSVYPHEVVPLPTPTGYNKIPFNGHYQENVTRYGGPFSLEQYQHLYHFPPVYYDNTPNLNYSGSFNNNYSPTHNPQIAPKKTESFRIGNQELINELKQKHQRKQNTTASVPPATPEPSTPPVPPNLPPPVSPTDDNPYGHCNNLQDLVQKHDEVFN